MNLIYAVIVMILIMWIIISIISYIELFSDLSETCFFEILIIKKTRVELFMILLIPGYYLLSYIFDINTIVKHLKIIFKKFKNG